MMANLMMPSLVELNDIATEKFPDQEETVANISAGIYNTTSAVGYLIAPQTRYKDAETQKNTRTMFRVA